MADEDGARNSSGWRGPDVPVWQGLLLIALVITLAAAIAFTSFLLAFGAISLVIAAVQLLATFDVLQVPDGPASPFVRNTNPRWVKVAMAGVMGFVGGAMILLATLA